MNPEDELKYIHHAGNYRLREDGSTEVYDGTTWIRFQTHTDWESVAADQAMTIAMLKVDIDRLVEAMTLAKIQGSRKDCNRILEEALDQYSRGNNEST